MYNAFLCALYRVVVINVNTPETRGSAFAFFNLADDIGIYIYISVLSLAISCTKLSRHTCMYLI